MVWFWWLHRMLGSNPGLLRLWHWQSVALTTRLDHIRSRLDLIHIRLDFRFHINNVNILPICVQDIFSTYWKVDFEQFCWLFSWTRCSSQCCSCCCEDCSGLDCCSPSGYCCCCCYCYCCCGPQPPCCWWREPSCTSYRCWEGQRCWERMVLLVAGRSANAAASWAKKNESTVKERLKILISSAYCRVLSLESPECQLLSEHFLLWKEKKFSCCTWSFFLYHALIKKSLIGLSTLSVLAECYFIGFCSNDHTNQEMRGIRGGMD